MVTLQGGEDVQLSSWLRAQANQTGTSDPDQKMLRDAADTIERTE
jgi:hypothetical protein